MNWPTEFNLDDNHCSDVLLGAYDCPVEAATVLDIGANVGAFARWAKQRWPNAKVHCYEPQPFNFSLLKMTIKHYDLQNVWPHEVGVSDKEGNLTLYENGFNCGEWSLIKFDENGTREISVQIVAASTLPDADFIKIDTEGVEPNILKGLLDSGKLAKANAVVLEYHSAVHVPILIWQCQQAGLRLFKCDPHMDHRGLLRFVRA